MKEIGHPITRGIINSKLSLEKFRRLGLLHEINRLILHPLGYALYVETEKDGSAVTLGGIYDMSDDPEGFCFAEDTLNPELGKRLAKLWHERMPAREKALGYMIQPLDGCPELNLSWDQVKELVDFLEARREERQLDSAMLLLLGKLGSYRSEMEEIFGAQ